ncbi:response regulator [Gynurincola endophyticus]|uniref:response regulator transcription factor n=1 Tax=Gynurincola endophyticus TaxID=2479004 RepID=UPI000F8D307D|nr:response regulator transcription factor [Gynurincola endophyticus]
MIKKVLIAEDHESASISVQKTLAEIGCDQADYVYYCDDALIRIEKACQSNSSYDLLITDLYFEEDHRKQQISNGRNLIIAARAIQPDLKVLVFSAEGRSVVVEKLFGECDIDGYVRKARGDAKELMKAIHQIDNNQRYFPIQFTQELKQNNHEFTEYDMTIISLMVQGKRQKEISEYLRDNNITPSGLSSIEKRLNYIKDVFGFSTNEQLIAHCVKIGVV